MAGTELEKEKATGANIRTRAVGFIDHYGELAFILNGKESHRGISAEQHDLT